MASLMLLDTQEKVGGDQLVMVYLEREEILFMEVVVLDCITAKLQAMLLQIMERVVVVVLVTLLQVKQVEQVLEV